MERQGDMIDKFVDLSLARYLEKSYGSNVLSDDDTDETDTGVSGGDFRQLLRDWSRLAEEKRKRGVCPAASLGRNFTTPKPGSIIKDAVPIENVVLFEAPLMEEGLQANLSDRAFQELGDSIATGVDTSRVKVYKGAEAVRKIEELEGHHESAPAPK